MNAETLKLIHVAARQAGLITPAGDGRYRLVLARYRTPAGTAVRSSTQLNDRQVDDFLAICESLGFRHPVHGPTYYRNRIAGAYSLASGAQQAAILHLAGDLGWSDDHLANFLHRQTRDHKRLICELTPSQAWSVIEAMKSMFARQSGLSQTATLKDVQEATDGCPHRQTHKTHAS